jgi:hypothetical protein
MSFATLLVILLVWTVAGLLAAIAFGKMVRETTPEDEESLATSAGTVKYLRKTKDKSRAAPERAPVSHRDTTKHASG